MRVLLGLVLCAVLCSCAETTILTKYEEKIGINDGESRAFHSTLYYPKGLSLNYPGYLVGIQKAEQEKIHGPKMEQRTPHFLKEKVPYFDNEKNIRWCLGSNDILKNVKNDSKPLFVAHITKYYVSSEKQPKRSESDELYSGYTFIDQCFLYNLFLSPFFKENKEQDLTKVIAWEQCENALSWDSPAVKENEFYDNGEYAIRQMGNAIADDLKNNGYTHVLILVMGWNTAQDEAIRNFNDIIGNIIKASKELPVSVAGTTPFRPLVVGVTWPSYWSKKWWNPFSYGNKAHDADELGLSWLNLITNDVVPSAISKSGKKVPLVVIGHSFGGRAVTRAAFSSPALKRADDTVTSNAALVVALQGAVSINRFSDKEGDEGGPYRDFKALKSTRIVLTAAANDSATGGQFVFWFDPAGSIKSYALACDNNNSWWNSDFYCLTAHDSSGKKDIRIPQKTGEFKLCQSEQSETCSSTGSILEQAPRDAVVYIDASDEITKYNTLNTGGGAHSDIYRLPMGRLLWRLLQAYAPAINSK